MIRHGTQQPAGPALIALFSAPKVGKSRLAAAAMRGDPERFGARAAYIAVDPEAISLGSILPADRDHLEVVELEPKKDLFKELRTAVETDWRKDGIKTVIIDTMTVWSQDMMAQLANAGTFSDKHIKLADGVYQPMPGDFLGIETLTFAILRAQKASGLNFINIFHEREDRPEPGTPGDPVGGPATVGRASIRKIAGWHDTVLRMALKPRKRTDLTKPLEYDRVIHTAPHGIWQAGLRTPHEVNPIPEIIASNDPVNVWQEIKKALSTETK